MNTEWELSEQLCWLYAMRTEWIETKLCWIKINIKNKNNYNKINEYNYKYNIYKISIKLNKYAQLLLIPIPEHKTCWLNKNN